jgi:hypothetical protein
MTIAGRERIGGHLDVRDLVEPMKETTKLLHSVHRGA